jgi:acetylornithine/N-succinyldiaminopimelate aminotransferase
VLDAVLEPGFLENVQNRALYFKQRLAQVRDEFSDLVHDVRGNGFLTGLRLAPPAGDVMKACTAAGLLTVSAGDNVLRLLPPLNVTEEELGHAIDRLTAALKAVRAAASA